jgi:meiotic recombination protein SPO11
VLSAKRPQLEVYALVDFDPDGIAILRNYKYGSQRLSHEEDVTVPQMKWLGIKSHNLLKHPAHLGGPNERDSASQESQENQSNSDAGKFSTLLEQRAVQLQICI